MGYSFSQLQDLWKQAGGNPASATMAAAVAMAESGGNPNSTNHNTNGTTDRGLWQINSIHGSLSVFDPMANARAAVQISNNGTTWRPWCTAWSNGACGGTYLGQGSPFLRFMPNGAEAPPDNGDSSGGDTTTVGFPNPLKAIDPNTWVQAFLRPLGVWLWYGAMMSMGAILVVIGVILLIRETTTAQTLKGVVIGAATRGAVQPAPKVETDEVGITRPAPRPTPERAPRRTAQPSRSLKATQKRYTYSKSEEKRFGPSGPPEMK